MIDLWVPITILAAFSQNLRSIFQRKLQSNLSDMGSTYVRFLYGLPFAILYLIILSNFYEISYTGVSLKFLSYSILGGISQILATFLLLKIFNYDNFAVGTAYSKTEPIQALFFSIIILSETVNKFGFIGIFLGVLGVILISYKSPNFISKNSYFKYTILLGLLSGTLFGVSAVLFRGASLSLTYDSLLLSSAITLVIVLFIQTTILSLYLLLVDKKQIYLTFYNFKDSIIVGVFGALASICWFYAMSIQNVAYVRTLGQIELIFTIFSSLFYFKEKIIIREFFGIIIVLVSLIVIILYT